MALLALILGCPGEPTPPDTEPPVPVEDTADPALPETPLHDLDDFQAASTCEACHPDHVSEWSQSRHAYAMEDPLFRKLTDIRRSEAPELDERFCTQCHSAIGTRTGDVGTGFDFELLDPLTQEGVTCQACHTIDEVIRPGNAGHRLDPEGPMRGPIAEPMETTAHDSEFSPLFEQSLLCASCHDVTEESGLPLERPYAEWLQSPAGQDARPCQSCHMPTRQAPAAAGGPERTVHSHRWLGVEDGLELLEGSATVLLKLPDAAGAGQTLPITVTVRNEIDGHDFPTGTTFLRQCWLEVLVLDGERVVYASGLLDENQDLMDHWSELSPYGDPDLVSLSSGFIDDQGDPTLFTHRAAEHTSNAIPALHQRSWTWLVELPEEELGSELQISVRLRFRAAPPFLLRTVGLPDAVDIVDIDADAGAVPIQE